MKNESKNEENMTPNKTEENITPNKTEEKKTPNATNPAVFNKIVDGELT